MNIYAEFGGAKDADKWATLHAAGEQPDEIPYGLQHLADFGHQVVSRPAPPKNKAWKVLSTVVSRVIGDNYQALEALRDRHRRLRSDVVVCWDERAGLPAAFRSRRKGEPLVVTGVIWLTEDDRKPRAATDWLIRRSLASAQAIFVLADSQRQLLIDRFGLPASRIHHVAFGVDDDFWAAEPLTDVQDGLVVSAGNDRHRDNATLVRAMEQVQRSQPNSRLRVLSHRTTDVPAVIGTAGKTAHAAEMRSWYSKAAVVAVPTTLNRHGSGMTVALEAMACGRPVVATDTGGMSEYVDHGRTGLLVPPENAEAFAQAITELLNDPDRAKELGQAGSKEVRSFFNTRAMCGRLDSVIQSAAI